MIKIPAVHKKYEYRSIHFHLTSKGYWAFDDMPSCPGWNHWGRFFTAHEIDSMYMDTKKSEAEQVQIMRNAIDRMLANAPAYTGDLRFMI